MNVPAALAPSALAELVKTLRHSSTPAFEQERTLRILINAAFDPEGALRVGAVLLGDEADAALGALVELMQSGSAVQQMLSLWLLFHVALGDGQAVRLVQRAAEPAVRLLLRSHNADVLTKALWLLTPLAGAEHDSRALLTAAAMPALVRVLELPAAAPELLLDALQPLKNLLNPQCTSAAAAHAQQLRNAGGPAALASLLARPELQADAVAAIQLLAAQPAGLDEPAPLLLFGPLAALLDAPASLPDVRARALAILLQASLDDVNERALLRAGVLPRLTALLRTDAPDRLLVRGLQLLLNLSVAPDPRAAFRPHAPALCDSLLELLAAPAADAEARETAAALLINLAIDEPLRLELRTRDAAQLVGRAQARAAGELTSLLQQLQENLLLPVAPAVQRAFDDARARPSTVTLELPAAAAPTPTPPQGSSAPGPKLQPPPVSPSRVPNVSPRRGAERPNSDAQPAAPAALLSPARVSERNAAERAPPPPRDRNRTSPPDAVAPPLQQPAPVAASRQTLAGTPPVHPTPSPAPPTPDPLHRERSGSGASTASPGQPRESVGSSPQHPRRRSNTGSRISNSGQVRPILKEDELGRRRSSVYGKGVRFSGSFTSAPDLTAGDPNHAAAPADVSAEVDVGHLRRVKPRRRPAGADDEPEDEEDVRATLASRFLENELEYCLNLQNTFKIFYKPLVAGAVPLPASDISILFCNVDKLLKLIGRLFVKLNARIGQWENGATLGDLFEAFLNDKDIVAEYCLYMKGLDEALTLYNHLYKENSAFRTFMEDCVDEKTNWLFLPSFLQLPQYRLPQYKEWLARLYRATSPTHADYLLLERSISALERLMSTLSDVAKQAALKRKCKKVRDAFSLPQNDQCTLVHEGMLQHLSTDETQPSVFVYLYLFSDSLLWTLPDEEPDTEQALDLGSVMANFPLQFLSVQPLLDTETVQHAFRFIVAAESPQFPGATFDVTAGRAKDKTVWITSLSEVKKKYV